MNSDVSTDTFPVTARASAVITSTRFSCELTWPIVALALVSSGSEFSCALRMAIVASSSVRPSLISGMASMSTSSANDTATMSAAI